MNVDTKKQAGFGAVAIIAALLVVAVLGFVGWRLYSLYNKPATTTSTSHTTSSSQSNNQSSTQQQTDPNAGYMVIKEWGVRFKPVSGLSGLSYSITSSQRPNAVEAMLMTDQLKATTRPACNGTASGSRPLGAIVRTQTAEDLSQHENSDQLLKQVNGYYYYYYEPAQLCDSDPNSNSINDLQNNTLNMIKTSLASLEAAK